MLKPQTEKSFLISFFSVPHQLVLLFALQKNIRAFLFLSSSSAARLESVSNISLLAATTALPLTALPTSQAVQLWSELFWPLPLAASCLFLAALRLKPKLLIIATGLGIMSPLEASARNFSEVVQVNGILLREEDWAAVRNC